MRHKLAIAAFGTAVTLGALAIPALAQGRAPAERGHGGPAAMFEAADSNKDGRVTSDEAWSALSARFAEADADKDGGVTWEEARRYAEAHRGAPMHRTTSRMEERGQGIFRGLDADRDGKVTLAELRPAAEAMFRARDTNGDGVLTREEVGPHHRR